MSLISTLSGTWVGYGQMYDAVSKHVLDTIEVSISFEKDQTNKLVGTKRIQFLKEKLKSYSVDLGIEIVNEMEMNILPEWSESPIPFMYMENPVSFQGNYITDTLGPNTHHLDNNFILNGQWQIHIEAKSDTSHVAFDYVLEKSEPASI